MSRFGVRFRVLVKPLFILSLLSLSNLEKFKKGPCISGIKAYNHLPQYLKTLDHNSSSFRSSLKSFMHQHAFYSVEEYYEYKENTI